MNLKDIIWAVIFILILNLAYYLVGIRFGLFA